MLKRIKDGVGTPMDLDIIDGVCDQIMGNCLCVLGDAMAMPVSSMIKHFRGEFEEYMEAKRAEAGLGPAIPQVNRGRGAGPYPMDAPTDIEPVPVGY
jgi:NADH-quinone oxidoreductase subunit F